MLIFRNGTNTGSRNFQGEPSIRNTERALRDAGLSRKEAKSLLAIGYDASAAMYGWPVDTLRDAEQNRQPQPDTLRDAGMDGPHIDIYEDLMSRIKKQLE